ncbi:fibulin-5 isoform X6 [Drosophila mojavensis]|uniref:fibulin-5 isoform X6 n=1 Tax=Drosophila mojavensis TaxID=7230 RepID=UPI001CD05E0D|nr:fibulin-5 isoform X6 [Drosophila mojavensis]
MRAMKLNIIGVILCLIFSYLDRVLADEQIADYIRKCCISGLRNARTTSVCDKMDSTIVNISNLWLGLCSSTFGVCCSKELDRQNCELGRLAALEGASCNKGFNLTSTSYTNCCRACQVGLAVKASQQKCTDPLFSFLLNIDSYRLCCSDDGFSNSELESESGLEGKNKLVLYTDHDEREEEIVESRETVDGTIVLSGDDDICGKIPNLCEQVCINTYDAYRCSCHPGYKLNDNNVTCYADKNNICPSGYVLDGNQGKCVDIDECQEQLHDCKTSQYCHNTIGGYHCLNIKAKNCPAGYLYNVKSDECEDDDECIQSPCEKGYKCSNYPGGYDCNLISSETCGTGFLLKNGSCIDIDECAQSTTNSCRNDLHQECKNTVGNYHCNCLPGYSLDVTQNKCVDINECSINNHNCLPTQRCDNTIGSYICTRWTSCGTGYTLNAGTGNCDDINECETGDHNCGEKQICRNRNGGYICACPAGHQVIRLSDSVNSCEDINECAEDSPVCSSNANCYNTIGSYYCECKPGFQRKSLNSNANSMDQENWYAHGQCFDVDECQSIPGLCQQKCVNFWGGYRCTCNQGYELSHDNRTCNDIDECEVHKDYKLCMGFCINTPGSYQCSCPRGYTLASDKTSCRDIDECDTTSNNHVCTGRNDICTNIRGSFKCTTINCPSGYMNDADQKNRCRQSSNFCEGEECYTKPSAFTYNFITFVSKLMIPPDGRTIFTLRGPIWYDDIDFELKIIRVQAAPNIVKATDSYFDTLKSNNQVNVILKKKLEGPQDVELALSMTVFTNGMPRGKSVAKLFLFVSQYTF